ncbi:MAG: O-antigen translocase [Porphyrobacter sp.]|jgi:PST family polysaccharide transporter|nr:O-antigen translocase [Porphyrobacter sp.]
MSESSYRTILRSSSIIGGAQAINVLANLVRMKVLALLLGPVGVGLAGLYLSLIQTGSTVAALGLGTAGTRQIAAANGEGDAAAMGRVRRALFWATAALALLGGAVFWGARAWIADFALGDPAKGDQVGWLAIGVALTVASGSQGALLTGLRRIGDLARLQVSSGVAGALFGVLAVWTWGADGILVMVLVAPLVAFLAGHYFVARLPRLAGPRLGVRALWGELKALGVLGFAIMASALAAVASQLLVRVLVQRELGQDALGHFQAAWAISVTYLGFVLNAMGTDYFPRLSAVIDDPEAASRLVNEQTEVALLLASPVVIALLGLAPLVISILYSTQFLPAVEVLQWQLLGDLLKVISWPLGFVLLAASSGKIFIMAETVAVSVLLAGVAFGLPLIGIEATGVSFVVMYLVYLPVVFWLCARKIGFRWTRAVLVQAASVFGIAALVVAAARWSDILGGVLALASAGALGLWALVRISKMAQVGGARLAKFARLGERVKAWVTKP